MICEVYFFDSYAIIEILNGNENYKKYENCAVIITKLNLFEVFYSLLRNVDNEKADFFIDNYYDLTIDFNKNIIKKAAEFRLEHKKRKLSMTDCIGYVLALEFGVRFLTGDEEFKDMENVEYVK